MLGDDFLTEEEKTYRNEVGRFVAGLITPELLRQMDRNEVLYPVDFIRAMGRAG
ncbi:MAG: acyl-CoA dehydrogenase, partial [Clostridia bacterium]|nr:acyl-CoA dehydrogenase [Clostridia bacterium]